MFSPPWVFLGACGVTETVLVTGGSGSMPELQGILPGLGRRNRHSTAKVEAVLRWKRRPASETIVDCARSLIEHGVV